jgi:hypothetical protein
MKPKFPACIVLSLTVWVAVLAASTQPASAWSGDAHQLVANLAYERLTPAARSEVDRLVATQSANVQGCVIEDFARASTWPDCVRRRSGYTHTAPYHYINIPICGRASVEGHCPDGECVTEAIRRYERTLANRSASDRERLEALAFLSHFIADLHQPLHVANNGDRGGNGIRVTLPSGANADLHEAWDDHFARNAMRGQGREGIRSLVRQNARRWSGGDVDAWALEGHEIARRSVYWPLPARAMCGRSPQGPLTITDGYVQQSAPIIREQLARASVRLSTALNNSLSH